MGVKDFSKTFDANEVKISYVKDKKIAVDASVIAYQASLGMKSVNALTDICGNPTIHINVVIAKCLNFHKNGAKQSWIFDYHEKGYINPNKTLEIEKRKKIKEKAEKKIREIKSSQKTKQKNQDLFSSDDEDDEEIKQDQINQQEKMCFSLTDKIVNDIKFILDCFDIPWCDSPKGHEAEAVCAKLTSDEKHNESPFDLVWTTDTDAIIYGSKQIVRELKIKQKKKYMMYDLNTILEDKKIDMDDLKKIAVILGTDHAKKTPKIGPKTVLKKFRETELTNEQKKAVKVFTPTVNINQLKWSNPDISSTESFEDKDKIKTLLDWLEGKDFNRERIQKQINKDL